MEQTISASASEEPTTPIHPNSRRLAAEETPVRTNARKRPSGDHRTPTRTTNATNTNTPGSTSSTPSGADFWSEFAAATDGGVVGAVGAVVGATAETTERAVRNIFYTTRDRAEGNATPSKVGSASGNGRRRLKRPGSSASLNNTGAREGDDGRQRKFPEYRARGSDVRHDTSSSSAAAAAAPASPTASPGQTGSASNSKQASPKQSPGVRRTGPAGQVEAVCQRGRRSSCSGRS